METGDTHSEFSTQTEYKECGNFMIIQTFGCAFWALLLPAAAVVLAVYLAKTPSLGGVEVGCIIFAFVAFALLEIAAVKMFIAGLNEFYNHGKTGLVIGDNGVQIAFRTKLFKREMVFVPYGDMQKFCVYRDRIQCYRGDPYRDPDLSLKPYKVKFLKKGWITFCDLCGNEFSVHLKECMEAGAKITPNLDEEQINRGESDIRKGRKRKK